MNERPTNSRIENPRSLDAWAQKFKKPVREIVRDKQATNDPDTSELPGPFRGWYTRDYLPHCDKPGLIQMVTFRLNDAMPASRRHEWEALCTIKDERERQTQLEAYLDEGHGSCVLKEPRAAKFVEDALLFFDGERYRLLAWVVMPNHVHVLFEIWKTPLPEVVQSWKRHTATQINRLLGRPGTLWQAEYWDRFMRDEPHCNKALHYIEWNPVKAALVSQPAAWSFSSSNPKWTWNTGDGFNRYHGAHLIHANWPEQRGADFQSPS